MCISAFAEKKPKSYKQKLGGRRMCFCIQGSKWKYTYLDTYKNILRKRKQVNH